MNSANGLFAWELQSFHSSSLAKLLVLFMAKKKEIIKREVDFGKGRPLTLAHRREQENGYASPGPKVDRELSLLLRLTSVGSQKPFASHRNCFVFLSPTPALQRGLWFYGVGGIIFFFYQIALFIALKLASYQSVSQQI